MVLLQLRRHRLRHFYYFRFEKKEEFVQRRYEGECSRGKWGVEERRILDLLRRRGQRRGRKGSDLQAAILIQIQKTQLSHLLCCNLPLHIHGSVVIPKHPLEKI